MGEVLHGYIQLAKRTAEQAPYQIKPAASQAKGYLVWQCVPKMGWIAIASFNSQALAEDFVCGQIAVLGE